MKAEKNYTSDQILKEFNKLTKDKTIDVLFDALDCMQQYNGRSKMLCVAMAMGYENYEGESDTYTKAK